MQIELLTRDRDEDHDLTSRLTKALVLLEEPVTMKQVLVWSMMMRCPRWRCG